MDISQCCSRAKERGGGELKVRPSVTGAPPCIPILFTLDKSFPPKITFVKKRILLLHDSLTPRLVDPSHFWKTKLKASRMMKDSFTVTQPIDRVQVSASVWRVGIIFET